MPKAVAVIRDRGNNEPYSDSNPPETLMVTETAAPPATPPAGLGVYYVLGSDSRPRFKTDGGQTFSLATIEPYPFSVTGVLSVQAGASRIYFEGDYAVESVRAAVSGAPAGSSLIVDVNKNGSTIFTTQADRPTIAAAAFTALGTGTGLAATYALGDFMTVDIDQVGSTTPGTTLTVLVRMRRL